MWKRSDATTWRYKMFPQCHNVTLYVNFEIKNNKKYLFQKLHSFSTYKIFLASKIHHLYPRGCRVCIDTHNARYCQIIPKRMIKKTSLQQSYIINVFYGQIHKIVNCPDQRNTFPLGASGILKFLKPFKKPFQLHIFLKSITFRM